jgi:hypothetical protein
MGYALSGFTIKGKEDFSSIPGLLLWVDSRFNVNTLNDGTYDRVTSWSDLSGRGMVFSSAVPSRRPIYQSGYVLFDPDLTSSAGHRLADRNLSRIQAFKPIWNKPSKHGIYIIANDIDGQLANTPAFGGISMNSTGGNTNAYNLYHNREGVGDPDSRHYLLRRYDGVNELKQSGYIFNWQNTISSFAEVITDEASNNLKFYRNNTLGYTASVSNTAPSVSPDVNEVSLSDVTSASGKFRLYVKIVYDWTSLTLVEAQSYDLKVRTLLETLRLSL